MEIVFDDKNLDRLETDPQYTAGFAHAIVSKFRQRVGFIRRGTDERDLYAMKSFRFERLKGSRSHQHSMRLNDQWRLIVELRGEVPNKLVAIVSIEDYH
jgi:proteic killer suppression protein